MPLEAAAWLLASCLMLAGLFVLVVLPCLAACVGVGHECEVKLCFVSAFV